MDCAQGKIKTGRFDGLGQLANGNTVFSKTGFSHGYENFGGTNGFKGNFRCYSMYDQFIPQQLGIMFKRPLRYTAMDDKGRNWVLSFYFTDNYIFYAFRKNIYLIDTIS